jgi:homoserine dehydrogenase
MRIVLIGFGTVGQGLVEILRDKAADLKLSENFVPQLVGVVTRSRGSLYHPNGLDLNGLLTAIKAGSLDQYPDTPGLERGWNALQTIQAGADVMVEAGPSNFETGQPALDYCYAALENGQHIVLANKGPVAVAYHELVSRAKAAGKKLRFEATVMAGTPSIRLGTQALAGCKITQARGILNGTTNYILTQMEDGMTYADALARAQALGYAEADPTADVDGWDAAAKAIILAAALFRARLTLKDMNVRGIRDLTTDDVTAAKAAGERWKLIAQVTPAGGSVQPTRVPLSHPLAGVSGATNAVTYITDLLGDITLVGAGAGRLQTGFGVLSDLLEINEGELISRI